MPRLRTLRPIAGLLAAAPCVAQVPPRAVVLNPSGALYEPVFARSGDTIHACGITPSYPGGFVHYARSDDGGATWPVREQVIAFAPEFDGLAADGDVVVALVQSPYTGPYTITSRDGGHTWALPVRVSLQSTQHQMTGARVLVHGSDVLVTWYEERTAGRVFCNRSADGGATWQASDTRLDVGAAAGALNLYFNRMLLCADWPIVNVVWDHAGTAGFTAHTQRSVDGGITWLPAARPLAIGKLDGVAGYGNAIAVVGHQPPVVLCSVDAGLTFTPALGHGLGMPAQVAVDGSVVVVTGNTTAAAVAVEANVSYDGGLTWPRPPQVLAQGSRVVLGDPAVAAGTCFVRCQYLDAAGPGGQLFVSDDFGASWRLLPGEAGVRVAVDTDHVLVATHVPVSSPQTLAYVAAGHTRLGAGTPGTNGRVPRLVGHALPLLGHAFQLRLSGALPTTAAVLATSFAPPVSVPLGAATLVVGPPIVPVLLVTDVAGAGGLGVTVPSSAAFAGLVLTSQAFVLDPMAAGGFCATAARRTWIE